MTFNLWAPWEFEAAGNETIIRGKHDAVVCHVPFADGVDISEHQAVVHALTAAPDMLAALIDLLTPGQTSARVIEEARDLLARLGHDVRKAEGRADG